jgi:hypothetical protein
MPLVADCIIEAHAPSNSKMMDKIVSLVLFGFTIGEDGRFEMWGL